MTQKNQISNKKLLNFLKGFKEPQQIQDYLCSLKYNPVAGVRPPKEVIQSGTAHCLEGSILAAAILKIQGYKPLLFDLVAVNDDDHVLALFKKNGHWGALSKSNSPLTEYREPVYRSLRELAMSYFDIYFNKLGQKTLRKYSWPLNLEKYPDEKWIFSEKKLSFIEEDLNQIAHCSILNKKMKENLSKVNDRLYQTGFFGAVKEGIYRAKK